MLGKNSLFVKGKNAPKVGRVPGGRGHIYTRTGLARGTQTHTPAPPRAPGPEHQSIGRLSAIIPPVIVLGLHLHNGT
jgi:hypothetical protein